MKIEIEFEEIEKLKKEIQSLQRDKEELKIELRCLSQRNIQINALKLAHNLSDAYLKTIWEKLGLKGCRNMFNKEIFLSRSPELSVALLEGVDKFDFDSIKIEIGKEELDEWKGVFISMNLLP